MAEEVIGLRVEPTIIVFVTWITNCLLNMHVKTHRQCCSHSGQYLMQKIILVKMLKINDYEMLSFTRVSS